MSKKMLMKYGVIKVKPFINVPWIHYYAIITLPLVKKNGL